MKKILSFVLLFTIFSLIACDKTKSETQEKPKEGTVIATVGSSYITIDDFTKKLNSLPPQYKVLFGGEQGKEKFLDQMIREKLFVEKANALGLANKAEIKDTINEMKNNIIVRELYNEKMKEFSAIPITDADVDAELKNNTLARASHILMKDEKKAKEALKRVKKGEDFFKLAAELSEDPSAKMNKGDLGTFGKGEMVPEFETAIFAMKIGDVTEEVVKTQFGFHIIKRTEPDKEEVKKNLVNKKQMDRFEQWMNTLKQEIPTKIDKEVLKKVPSEMANAGMQGMPAGHPAAGGEGQGMPAGHPATGGEGQPAPEGQGMPAGHPAK